MLCVVLILICIVGSHSTHKEFRKRANTFVSSVALWNFENDFYMGPCL